GGSGFEGRGRRGRYLSRRYLSRRAHRERVLGNEVRFWGDGLVGHGGYLSRRAHLGSEVRF
ncbi:hypothetical protein, partial [Catenulispora pinisilvae]|uniref:hypothetical protein n=1 Tax=Catenulispora pinisilvae TaxID=2705253 RepID=UPI001E5590D6